MMEKEKLPVERVYDLLIGSKTITHLVRSDFIYTLDVPEDYQKVENAPMIRINEIGEYQSGFATNEAIQLRQTVQIDVWGIDIQMLKPIRNALDAVMSGHQWALSTSALDKDPDISLLRLARRYTTTLQT
ncbi:hypothetical protein NSQ26_13920 [Bacillus sp. FSL W7-1360]